MLSAFHLFYEIQNQNLRDDSGRIVQQVFFMAMRTAKHISLHSSIHFHQKNGRLLRKKNGTKIRSLKGNVWIYANRPLDIDANLDDSAQVHLNKYLETNELFPSVVIHRGHSYGFRELLTG